ncbi:MAG TPA: hypothetical protein VMM56_06645 [Planctomycetaceae bacterium]|nr:hypothetical protein [Planctomycetaceae bacterium]
MILSRLREEPGSRTKEEFYLFKPLLLIALGVLFFELLPIDFQHAIAPQLVSYEDVFEADICRFELLDAGVDEMISVNTSVMEGFSLNPAAMRLRN